MERSRAIKLRRETLVELMPDDLGQVVGASGPSCNPNLCPTACTSCASDFQQCFTGYGCPLYSLDCPHTGDTVC